MRVYGPEETSKSECSGKSERTLVTVFVMFTSNVATFSCRPVTDSTDNISVITHRYRLLTGPTSLALGSFSGKQDQRTVTVCPPPLAPRQQTRVNVFAPRSPPASYFHHEKQDAHLNDWPICCSSSVCAVSCQFQNERAPRRHGRHATHAACYWVQMIPHLTGPTARQQRIQQHQRPQAGPPTASHAVTPFFT